MATHSSAGTDAAVEELAEFLCDEYEGKIGSFCSFNIETKDRWRDLVRAMLARIPAQPQTLSTPPVPSGKVLLPRKLTAESGAKYALIGEFFEEIEVPDEDSDDEETKIVRVPVTWTTIKAIWVKAVDHFEALDKQERESMVAASEEATHGGDPAA